MLYRIADADYLAYLKGKPLDNLLFLEPSEEFPHYWMAGGEASLLASFGLEKFEGISVFDFGSLYERSQEMGSEIVFFEDPAPEFEWLESLNRYPGVEVDSDLPGTKWGFFPHQIQAINFLDELPHGGYAWHSTGTGKTLVAEGTLLKQRQRGMDLCLYVVKPNNLTNSQRKLLAHTGLESIILKSKQKTRRKRIEQVDEMIAYGQQPILIMNAEKLREDKAWFEILVEDRNVFLIVDEVPTKYANRATLVYKATAEIFYSSYFIPKEGKNKGKKIYYPRAGFEKAKLFGLEMSATPILNDPEDFFNSLRLIDPGFTGSIDQFMKDHAGPRNPWGRPLYWRQLDLFRAKVSGIVHQVDKDDPTIAKYFPKKLPSEICYCDLDSASAKLYQKLMDQYDIPAIMAGDSIISRTEILSALQVLQMICSNPRSVLQSAKARAAWEQEWLDADDAGQAWLTKHKRGSAVALKLVGLIDNDALFTDQNKKGECIISKMLEMKYRLENHHDKAIVFTDRNETLLPYLQEWLTRWGMAFVVYTGQEQESIDVFRRDSSVQIFLSTDAGSDSIDLPEASLTLNYDIPWTWAKIVQRFNRQDRIDSHKEVLKMVTLLCPDTFEERKYEIVKEKKYYGEKMGRDIGSMDTQSLLYMLAGIEAK